MNKAILILCGVIVLLILLKLGAEWWVESKVRDALDTQVMSRTHGACAVEVGKIRVNLFSRSLRLRDIRLRADSACLDGVNPHLRSLNVDIGSLYIRGVRFRLKKEPRRLLARSLDIVSPNVVIHSDSTGRAKEELSEPREPFAVQVAERFGVFGITEIGIRDGHIEYRSVQGEDTTTYIADRMDLRASGFRIDSTSQATGRAFFSEDVRLAVEKIVTISPGGASVMQADSLRVETGSGRLSLEGLEVIPQFPKYEYAQRVEGHRDWTQLRLGRLEGAGVDLGRLLTGGGVRIDSVSLASARIESYKNRQLAADNFFKPLVWESVQRLALPLYVGQVSLNDTEAVYEELSVNGDEPGRIFFDRLHGVLYDLTNNPAEGKEYMTLVAEGRVMGQGVLQATFLFPVDSLNNHFEVKGRLGGMPLGALDPMIGPLAKIEIKSGQIHSIDFHITGTDERAGVEMTMLYNGLQVALMKEKNDHLTERKFLSGLVNQWILVSGNPGRGGVRTVYGSAVRDPNRSQFNFLWRTLMSGIKETVGLPG